MASMSILYTYIAYFDIMAADRLFHRSFDLLPIDGRRDLWNGYQKSWDVAGGQSVLDRCFDVL